MENVRSFVEVLQRSGARPGHASDPAWGERCPVPGIYAQSLANANDATFFLARLDGVKHLIRWGNPRAAQPFEGTPYPQRNLTVIPCDSGNVAALHALFPFTAPLPVSHHRTTFGTGDRLGLATPGHIRAIRAFDAVPVLAQQSLRELTLTGRTFPDVIATATWGVFQEHFTAGYGADADHLKTEDEIDAALRQGATMITLDCSDHIDPGIAALSAEDALARARLLPVAEMTAYQSTYLNRDHTIRSATGQAYTIRFTPHQLASAVLTYGKALQFARRIYEEVISGATCDFELSIDETQTPTDPAAHFFVASELQNLGVTVTSLAPRFVGEFQKGVDYVGDLSGFEREFALHAALADHFGYKLSIHSGSDKFSIFPIIGKYTGGRLHHKTAGTSWLEALRLVAATDAALFRSLYDYARESFPAAARYYSVGVQPERLPSIGSIPDEKLPGLLDDPGHRQLLHITYGSILRAEDGGRRRFATRLYSLLNEQEETHYTYVARHISRHLRTLGTPSRSVGDQPNV
jgi:hypothetical protein